MPKQKLELTWVGKGQDPEVEPGFCSMIPLKTTATLSPKIC